MTGNRAAYGTIGYFRNDIFHLTLHKTCKTGGEVVAGNISFCGTIVNPGIPGIGTGNHITGKSADMLALQSGHIHDSIAVLYSTGVITHETAELEGCALGVVGSDFRICLAADIAVLRDGAVADSGEAAHVDDIEHIICLGGL